MHLITVYASGAPGSPFGADSGTDVRLIDGTHIEFFNASLSVSDFQVLPNTATVSGGSGTTITVTVNSAAAANAAQSELNYIGSQVDAGNLSFVTYTGAALPVPPLGQFDAVLVTGRYIAARLQHAERLPRRDRQRRGFRHVQ